MDFEIKEVYDMLMTDKQELEQQLSILSSIDTTKPIDEETWHQICETPLKTSKIMIQFVKNIFPDATDIRLEVSFIFFQLYGFTCAIPLFSDYTIRIDTNWYIKDFGEPKTVDDSEEARMREYFIAKDENKNWNQLLTYLEPYNKDPKWKRWFLWYCKYKWKEIDREQWEHIFDKNDELVEELKKSYDKDRDEMYQKTKIMIEQVIPKLQTFSKNVSSIGKYRYQDILKWEDLDMDVV